MRNAEQVVAAARNLMAVLQDHLGAGIDALEAGAWQPFAREGPAPHWSLEWRADGTIRRIDMGGCQTITLASAADLLVRWWPQLAIARIVNNKET